MAISMFTFTTIEAYQDWLAGNPEGCRQAVRHYLDEIQKQTHLNAFLEVYSAEALARATDLDEKRAAGKPMGKLHGVVIALKDVIAHQGHTLTAASRILAGFTAIYNA